MNDALKSLLIAVPSGGNDDAPVTVRYPSEETLFRTLRSLKSDLSGNPGIAEILEGLKGEELEVNAPNPIRGRILAVERRVTESRRSSVDDPRIAASVEIFLSLLTGKGIQVINLNDIGGFSFVNQAINADLARALDLIRASRNDDKRGLVISVPGRSASGSSDKNEIAVSYVIPVPVWKVSYRLDISGTEPLLQAWAIVDNDSDTDWENVELSLVSGKPVSFVQDLYSPYHVYRPVLPLEIAGAAAGRPYDSALSSGAPQNAPADFAAPSAPVPAPRAMVKTTLRAEADSIAVAEYAAAAAPVNQPLLTGGGTAAKGAELADQFEFTLKQPVTIKRRESGMLPLVEGKVSAVKTLVFSGTEARSNGGRAIHPGISAEITNTTGMPLPAGPITVYDGGSYAGDALTGFLPKGEKRIISYGDDLSVSGSVTNSGGRRIASVTVSRGVMTINRKQSYETVYLLRNAAEETRGLIIEHPITVGAALTEPAAFSERTDTVYRFTQTLKPNSSLTFTVREERPVMEQVVLARTQLDSWLSYSQTEEIPADVKAALEKAVELKRKTDDAKKAQEELQAELARFSAEQDRIRKNLEAAGNQTPQGQEYLKRLSDQDREIDALNGRISGANKNVLASQTEYDNYLTAIRF
jgi:hypothetical protein